MERHMGELQCQEGHEQSHEFAPRCPHPLWEELYSNTSPLCCHLAPLTRSIHGEQTSLFPPILQHDFKFWASHPNCFQTFPDSFCKEPPPSLQSLMGLPSSTGCKSGLCRAPPDTGFLWPTGVPSCVHWAQVEVIQETSESLESHRRHVKVTSTWPESKRCFLCKSQLPRNIRISLFLSFFKFCGFMKRKG